MVSAETIPAKKPVDKGVIIFTVAVILELVLVAVIICLVKIYAIDKTASIGPTVATTVATTVTAATEETEETDSSDETDATEATDVPDVTNTTESYDYIDDTNETKECHTAECYLLQNMNLSADPCNDFFNYVCGGWVKKYEHLLKKKSRMNVLLLADEQVKPNLLKLLKSKVTSSSNAVKEASTFFHACLKKNPKKEITGIKTVVKDFGGFPMYNKRTYDKEIPWYVRAATVMRQFGRNTKKKDVDNGVIFNFEVKQSVVYLKPPQSFFARSSFNKPWYITAIEKGICNFLKSSCTAKEMKSVSFQAKKMLGLMHTINIYRGRGTVDNERMSVQGFEERYPELHLFEFLKELFKDSVSDIGMGTTVSTSRTKYWSKLREAINNTDRRVIDNLIGWSTLEAMKYVGYTHNRIQDRDESQCFHYTMQVFQYPIIRWMADKNLEARSISLVNNIVNHYKNALIELVYEKDWLTPEVKKEAASKIDLIDDDYICYPSWLLSDRKLDGYFNLTKPLPRSSFIERYRSIFSFQMNEMLTPLKRPIYKESRWKDLDPFKNNAVYDRSKNVVIIPFSQFLFPNFFNDTKALAYGTASSHLGHEITHALGDRGSHRDGYGHKRNWWNEQSRRAFEGKMQCLVYQHDGTVDRDANTTLSGSFTKDENLADYGGVRLAYRAYLNSGAKDERLPGLLKHLTDKQLFFIGAGMGYCGVYAKDSIRYFIWRDNHAPDHYRVFMPSANMDEFSKIFNCPLGSKMNPRNKCSVW